jgi:CDP-diacylglycerol---glycerol-3-phosphate 3-phosphatidyltransferase
MADLYGFDPFRYAGWFLVYSALALTVIRGVPVLVDAMYYISQPRGASR